MSGQSKQCHDTVNHVRTDS